MIKQESTIELVRKYFTETVWQDLPDDASPSRHFWLKVLRVLIIVIRNFNRDNCMLRASALTYASLLSIVPLLAFAFAILKGLGVQNQIEPILIENLAVGSEAVVTRIIEYINNTNVAKLGTVGLGMLLLTILALLSNIEESFNTICHVGETRTLMRRFADYFSVLAFGPLLIVVAVSMTATIQSLDFVQTLQAKEYLGDLISFAFKTLPYVAMWIAFTFLYVFMPNMRVNLPAAIIGGVIGGTLWQLGQIGYVLFQVGVARYNAIYGTMAALPIFMVWIYFSWMVVLFGLEITSAIQNLKTISHKIRAENERLCRHDFIGLTILLAVSRAFIRGDAPLSDEELADRLDLLPGQVIEAGDDLMSLGYFSRAVDQGRKAGYLPHLAPESILVKDVLCQLRGRLPDARSDEGQADWSIVRELSEELAVAEKEVLSEMTVRDLAMKTI